LVLRHQLISDKARFLKTPQEAVKEKEYLPVCSKKSTLFFYDKKKGQL
jgi:hypothetical protein